MNRFNFLPGSGWLCEFAYLGKLTAGSFIFSIPLVVATITDTNSNSLKLITPFNIIICSIVVLSLFILLPTALYISYTPVGSDTVLGFQGRYLIPLFPVLFGLCLNFKIKNIISVSLYNRCILGYCQIVLLIDTFIILTSKLSVY